jgi:hypothetical protein
MKWLRENGFIGLECAMRKRPELFAHIAQGRERRSLHDNVALAEDLRKKYGTLPSPRWLEDNGYSGLAFVMRRHREDFAHIPQDKKLHSLSESVALAESIIRAEGRMPSCDWLRGNGYSGLDYMIRKYPNAFRHLKRSIAA